MRRDNLFGTAIFVFSVLFIVLGTIFIPWPDFQHKEQLSRVTQAASVAEVRLTIRYDKPPLYREQYTMRNDNGISSARYTAQGYSGKVVTITLPPEKTYAVTFFFEKVVQDGIWRLMDKPPAGDTRIHYTLYVHQVSGSEQGSRTITFTDPHYWAVEAGRQYHIVLNPRSAVPDLTKLKSTSLADPRYEQIVQEFRAFGSSQFRAKVRQARALASGSK